MRYNNIALGIIAVSALLLQGCGKKGPLTYPAPESHKAESQQPDLQITSPQKTAPQEPTPQQPAAPATQP